MSDGSPVAQPPQAAEDAELQQAQQAAEPPPGGPPAAGPPQGEAPQPHGAAAEPAQGQPASPQAAHAAPGAAAAAAAAASPRVSPPAAAAAYSREAVAAALARWSGLRYRADGAGASKRFPWDVRFRLAPGPGLKKVVNDIARVQTPEEGAVAFDLGTAWRQLHPAASFDTEPPPDSSFNFAASSYRQDAALWGRLRGARTLPAMRAVLKDLRDSGQLLLLAHARLALAGVQPSPPPAAAVTPRQRQRKRTPLAEPAQQQAQAQVLPLPPLSAEDAQRHGAFASLLQQGLALNQLEKQQQLQRQLEHLASAAPSPKRGRTSGSEGSVGSAAASLGDAGTRAAAPWTWQQPTWQGAPQQQQHQQHHQQQQQQQQQQVEQAVAPDLRPLTAELQAAAGSAAGQLAGLTAQLASSYLAVLQAREPGDQRVQSEWLAALLRDREYSAVAPLLHVAVNAARQRAA